jgi:hypothetical protein
VILTTSGMPSGSMSCTESSSAPLRVPCARSVVDDWGKVDSYSARARYGASIS